MDQATIAQLLEDGAVHLQEGWTPAALQERLAAVRAEGYATNLQETSDDEIGIAAPVYDHRSRVVASVLLAAPAYRINMTVTASLIEQCVEAAAKISTRLGNPASQ